MIEIGTREHVKKIVQAGGIPAITKVLQDVLSVNSKDRVLINLALRALKAVLATAVRFSEMKKICRRWVSISAL